MKITMFPGQGSQSKGMGGDLFDVYKTLTDKADEILGYSIKQLCLEDPNKELNETQFTQPAIYVVNALSYLKKIEEEGKTPDYCLGHSLGEFNALQAAGCFDFETGLKLVKERGNLMSRQSNGSMAAIINSNESEIADKLTENGLHKVDIANFNTPSQIVISGDKDEMVKAQSVFKYDKVLCIPLNTSGAFHSSLMEPAMHQFSKYIEQFTFSQPAIPVISNVTAKPYEIADLSKTLCKQIASPVKWFQSIEYLLSLDDNGHFEELGHGSVLSDMFQRLRKELVPQSETQSAEQLIDKWNNSYSVGTKVKAVTINDANLETRTQAKLLFGHKAVIYLKGYKGYFDLEGITAS